VTRAVLPIPGGLASNKLALCGIYQIRRPGHELALMIPCYSDAFYKRQRRGNT
jgi:hypothetical protein